MNWSMSSLGMDGYRAAVTAAFVVFLLGIHALFDTVCLTHTIPDTLTQRHSCPPADIWFTVACRVQSASGVGRNADHCSDAAANPACRRWPGPCMTGLSLPHLEVVEHHVFGGRVTFVVATSFTRAR